MVTKGGKEMTFLYSLPIGLYIIIFISIIIISVYSLIKNRNDKRQKSTRFAIYGMLLISIVSLLYRCIYEFNPHALVTYAGKLSVVISGVIFLISLFISAGTSYRRNEMSEKQKMLFRSSIPFFIMSLLCIILILIIRNL